MKRLLVLWMLAGLSAAACGDDSDDSSGDDDSGTGDLTGSRGDAAVSNDSGPISRGKQIDNVGGACTANSDCKGGGSLMCYQDFLGTPYPGGYCSATCVTDDECGSEGACPVAQLTSIPLVGQFITGFLPQNCLLKCDKAKTGACREDYECNSLDDVISNVAASSGFGGLGGIGSSLLGAVATQPYCLPPIEFPDAGILSPAADAGSNRDAGITGGLDASQGVDSGSAEAGS